MLRKKQDVVYRAARGGKGLKPAASDGTRLETFVGSASPHPLLEFGCTSCHRGQDRATEFGRAGHTPASKKMEKRWSKASAAG